MYPYKILNWYPHMMPNDVRIWEMFILQNPDAYTEVEYDVKVGTVPDHVTEHEDEAMQNEAALYQKKIDVVGHRDGGVDIIELKPRAGMSTIGQVKAYVALYKRDIDPNIKAFPMIITDTILPDMEELCMNEGVFITAV